MQFKKVEVFIPKGVGNVTPELICEGMVDKGILGENVSGGELLYLDGSDNKWYICFPPDPAKVDARVIALSDGLENSQIEIFLQGKVTVTGAEYDGGAEICLQGGGAFDSRPTDYVVGKTLGEDSFYFAPGMTGGSGEGEGEGEGLDINDYLELSIATEENDDEPPVEYDITTLEYLDVNGDPIIRSVYDEDLDTTSNKFFGTLEGTYVASPEYVAEANTPHAMLVTEYSKPIWILEGDVVVNDFFVGSDSGGVSGLVLIVARTGHSGTGVDVAVGHPAVVNCLTGFTFDGTNNVATFTAPGQALVLACCGNNRAVVVANIGSVDLTVAGA
jgi:hypothetical protein